MKPCDEMIQKTMELVERMTEIADEGDRIREDTGCGVLYGVLRDSAYKIKKLAETERENHMKKTEEERKKRDPGPRSTDKKATHAVLR